MCFHGPLSEICHSCRKDVMSSRREMCVICPPPRLLLGIKHGAIFTVFFLKFE